MVSEREKTDLIALTQVLAIIFATFTGTLLVVHSLVVSLMWSGPIPPS